MYVSPNGDYPRYPGDIQIENPEWSIGDPLPTGWVAVAPSDQPVTGTDETVVELSPEVVDGVLTQVWSVRPLTEDEIARRDARETLRAKLIGFGLNQYEVDIITRNV